MLRLTWTGHGEKRADHGPLRSGVVSITRLLRSLHLFFGAVPKTPLRVLCIVALDTIRVLRYAKPLTPQQRAELASLLDFQACTNAVWDRKPVCQAEYQALRQRLEAAGLGVWTAEYLGRLGELEGRRPPIGGDHRHFADVRSYRESVVRLSLATLTGIALNEECLEDAIRSTYCERDVALLFQMAMQCQIIDDVLDYSGDRSAKLPSFLTATASLPQAITMTADAARSYAAAAGPSTGRNVFTLEVALNILTAVTKLVVALARWREPRHAVTAQQQHP